MNTYLVAWSAKKYPWNELEDDVADILEQGHKVLSWGCGNTRSIREGDRIFLMKLGSEPKGLMGVGHATGPPYQGKHWGGTGRPALYIDVDFEILINPEKEAILTLDILKTGNLEKQNWTPQSSGITIKPEIAEELEGVWMDFLSERSLK